MRRTLASRIVTGLIVIAIGVLILGQVAHLWNVGPLADSWWTLFFIIPGIAGIASSGFHFWNVFLLFLGGWLLAEDQGWLNDNAWPFFLGAFLVVLGVYLIAGGRHIHHHHGHERNSDPDHTNESYHGFDEPHNANNDNSDYPDYTAIFTYINYVNRCANFRGGKASSVFGTMTVDLREISIAGVAVFEVAGVFGSLRVLAPKNVPLRVNVTPVFGGFYNTASYSTPTGGQPYLEIRGASVFGSIRIE